MNGQITQLQFSEWGHQASRDYVLNGTALNSSICKIASENELSPIQIQRVCEIANHHAYAQLFKTAEDKTFDFPLADSEKIMELTQEEPEKIASDYFCGPQGTKKDLDVNKVFNIASISNEPEVEEFRKTAQQTLSKIAASQDELCSRLMAMREEISDAENGFYKIAKEMVLNGADFGDICVACLDAWHESPNLLEKVATKLVKEGVFGAKAQHLQKTGEAVEAEYISPKLSKMTPVVQTKIINGNHPIIASINTLAAKYKEAGDIDSANTILEDRSRLIKTRVEDLNTAKKVDQFVQSEV